MPVYEWGCPACGRVIEVLAQRGEGPPEGGCPECAGPLRRRWSRVAVRYGSWGFKATDGLVRETRGRDYRDLRDRAERISDETVT